MSHVVDSTTWKSWSIDLYTPNIDRPAVPEVVLFAYTYVRKYQYKSFLSRLKLVSGNDVEIASSD